MKISLSNVNLYEFNYSGRDNKAVLVFGSMYDGSVIGVLECFGVTSFNFSTIENHTDFFEDPEYYYCPFIGEMTLTETADNTYQLRLEGHNDVDMKLKKYTWRESESDITDEIKRPNVVSSVTARALERVRNLLKTTEAKKR